MKGTIKEGSRVYFCPECKSSRLQVKVWHYLNTGEELGLDQEHDFEAYCYDCGETHHNNDLLVNDIFHYKQY